MPHRSVKGKRKRRKMGGVMMRAAGVGGGLMMHDVGIVKGKRKRRG